MYRYLPDGVMVIALGVNPSEKGEPVTALKLPELPSTVNIETFLSVWLATYSAEPSGAITIATGPAPVAVFVVVDVSLPVPATLIVATSLLLKSAA